MRSSVFDFRFSIGRDRVSALCSVVVALASQMSFGQPNPCDINPCGSGCPGRECNLLCGGNACAGGCPQRCNALVCLETATCDPGCGGDPCGIQCHCWDACPTTVCTPGCPQFNACSPNCVDPNCTPGCPGASLCNDGCVDQCNPVICPGNYCDTACNAAPQCDPLCGGSPCNNGCIDECNFFLCPQKLCDLFCRPIAACDPACGGNPCAANCPTTGCACPANRCFNLEIDYMVDTDHTHKPNQAELDAVIQMFACQGWTLNIQISDAIPHYDLIKADPITCLDVFHYVGEDASFGRLKQQYANHAFEPGWHYAIFAHDYQLKVGGNCVNTGSSGLADTPGNDLIVTLGSFSGQTGTAFDRAATLAHEFGHNLGLTHCGSNDPGGGTTPSCQNVGANMPNLASIMSYFYQLSGVRSNLLCQGLSFDEAALFKEIDYSHGTMCDLNENTLDEIFGTGMISVDWDCNNAISGTVAKDLNGNSNGWCSANSGLQALSDLDEWSFIAANQSAVASGSTTPRPLTPCITADEVQQYVVAGGCTPPTLSTEACEDRDMIYMHPAGGGGASGRCAFPYQNLQNAHNAAADGSVMFFRAGSYPQPGRVLLTKPMKLFNQPTAGQSTTVITAP